MPYAFSCIPHPPNGVGATKSETVYCPRHISINMSNIRKNNDARKIFPRKINQLI